MRKNNFGIYRNNYFKKANNFLPNSYFNNSENDSSLQNRIERSLYPSNKRSQPYRTNTIHNISDYDYNNNSNNDLIEDFKTTLMKTQQLTNELRQNKTIYRNNNNYNFNKNNKFSFDFNNNFNNKNYNLNLDSKISSDDNDSDKNFNTDDLDEEEEETSEENNSSFNKQEMNINMNRNKIINKNKNENEEKLKLSNQNLKNSNQQLKNENRILEVEITNYQNHPSEKKKNILTNYDQNLFSFITSLKKGLRATNKKNNEIVDFILDMQKNAEGIDKKNKKLIEEQKKLSEQIEINNRKKAEIQIMNEENEKKNKSFRG